MMHRLFQKKPAQKQGRLARGRQLLPDFLFSRRGLTFAFLFNALGLLFCFVVVAQESDSTLKWHALQGASPRGCTEPKAKQRVLDFVVSNKIVMVEIIFDDETEAKAAADTLGKRLLQKEVMVRVRERSDEIPPDDNTLTRIEIRREKDTLVFDVVNDDGLAVGHWEESCAFSVPEPKKANSTRELGSGKAKDPDDDPDLQGDPPPQNDELSDEELQDIENQNDKPQQKRRAFHDEGSSTSVGLYLDHMLWLDETRVASSSGGVVRHFAVFVGRDKKEVTLKEAIALSDDEELRDRLADIDAAWNGQQMMLWTFMGTGAAVSAAGLGLFLLPASDNQVPKDPWMLVGGLAMGTGFMVALGGGFFVPELLLPIDERIEEHDLRRMVREYNERLRTELQLSVVEDRVPTGIAD
ncbi:MAG: hypothetical protein GY822_25115 [Deltaproteobacteria bacterium]|nr:hypothetical protein [Deltaproteobacteria bacterium]